MQVLDLEAKVKAFEAADAAKPQTDISTADAAAAAATTTSDEIATLKELLAKSQAAAATAAEGHSAQVEEMRIKLHASETALLECRQQHAASELRVQALADDVRPQLPSLFLGPPVLPLLMPLGMRSESHAFLTR